MAQTVFTYLLCWALYSRVSTRKMRQKAQRFIAVSASLILAVGIAEATSWYWMIDYRQLLGRPMRPWEKPFLNVLDPQLIFIRKPNLQARGMIRKGNLGRLANEASTTIIRPYDVRYDCNGFRNDTDYSQADCIVVGDSFVEGYHVLSDELLTTHIADALGLTVVNLGQSGYGPQQELIVVERYGLPLQPKLCVWVFFEGNDLTDVWEYAKLLKDWPKIVANYFSRMEKSFTRNIFWWLGSQVKSRVSPRDSSRSGLLTSDEGFRRLWFGFTGDELSSSDIAALRITARSIADAYALCQENGIELVVVYAPTKFRVYADVCEFEDTTPIKEWTVNDLPQRLSERVSAISEEIGFLDLTPHLKNAARQGALLYFPTDTHWTPEGHNVAARSMIEFLRANYAVRSKN